MKFILVSFKQIKSRGGVLEQIKMIGFKSAIKWAISHTFSMWCSKPPHGQIDLKYSVHNFRSESFHWSYDSYNLFCRLLIWFACSTKKTTENRIFWDINRQIVDFLRKKSRSFHSDWTVKNQFSKYFSFE